MNRRHAIGLFVGTATLPALAANEPKPDPVLASVLGEWRGSLTSRDAGQPERTSPARLYVSALAPDEIALHFVYEDGPGKTAYGYERLRFEFASDTLVWISGAVEKTALVGRIVATANEAGLRRYVVDSSKDRALTRYTFEFSPANFTLKKDEVDAAGRPVNRKHYAFTRPA